jgi:hypothetical protein
MTYAALQRTSQRAEPLDAEGKRAEQSTCFSPSTPVAPALVLSCSMLLAARTAMAAAAGGTRQRLEFPRR